MTPQEILEIAARLIEHGPLPWGKANPPGTSIGEDRTCIVKAICSTYPFVPEKVWEALKTSCGISQTSDLPFWNDAPERTKEEVILALYDAKRYLP